MTTTYFDEIELAIAQLDVTSVETVDFSTATRQSSTSEVEWYGSPRSITGLSVIGLGDDSLVVPLDCGIHRYDLLMFVPGSCARVALSDLCCVTIDSFLAQIRIISPSSSDLTRKCLKRRLLSYGIKEKNVPRFLSSAVSVAGSYFPSVYMHGPCVYVVLSETGVAFVLGKCDDAVVVCDLQQSQVVILTSSAHVSRLSHWATVLTSMQPELRAWLPSWFPTPSGSQAVTIGATVPLEGVYGKFGDFKTYRTYVLQHVVGRTDAVVSKLVANAPDRHVTVSNPFPYAYCWLVSIRPNHRLEVMQMLEARGNVPKLHDDHVDVLAQLPPYYFVKFIKLARKSGEFHMARDDYNFCDHANWSNYRVSPYEFYQYLRKWRNDLDYRHFEKFCVSVRY